jgi:hypothetical protein
MFFVSCRTIDRLIHLTFAQVPETKGVTLEEMEEGERPNQLNMYNTNCLEKSLAAPKGTHKKIKLAWMRSTGGWACLPNLPRTSRQIPRGKCPTRENRNRKRASKDRTYLYMLPTTVYNLSAIGALSVLKNPERAQFAFFSERRMPTKEGHKRGGIESLACRLAGNVDRCKSKPSTVTSGSKNYFDAPGASHSGASPSWHLLWKYRYARPGELQSAGKYSARD